MCYQTKYLKGNSSFSYLEALVLCFLKQDSADRLFHKVKATSCFWQYLFIY